MKVFLSYTRNKDIFQKVSAFREHLEVELAMRSPGSIVFQDTSHIQQGDNFPHLLADELTKSDVLLVLLSPAWLGSDWCRREYALFTQDGLNSDRLQRILPVLWVETPQLVVSSSDAIARTLASINYADWRELRYVSWEDTTNQKAIGKLAERALALAGRLRTGSHENDGSPPQGDGATKKIDISLRVDFVFNARNGLRRVSFGLEKHTYDKVVSWMIDFKLFERYKQTDAFGDPLVNLHLTVEQALNKKAEYIAKNGLTDAQTAHVLGPAADDAKATAHGEISEEEASRTIQATLKQ